jgi:hypothetical protein
VIQNETDVGILRVVVNLYPPRAQPSPDPSVIQIPVRRAVIISSACELVGQSIAFAFASHRIASHRNRIDCSDSKC